MSTGERFFRDCPCQRAGPQVAACVARTGLGETQALDLADGVYCSWRGSGRRPLVLGVELLAATARGVSSAAADIVAGRAQEVGAVAPGDQPPPAACESAACMMHYSTIKKNTNAKAELFLRTRLYLSSRSCSAQRFAVTVRRKLCQHIAESSGSVRPEFATRQVHA